jgi:hypothetical protein
MYRVPLAGKSQAAATLFARLSRRARSEFFSRGIPHWDRAAITTALDNDMDDGETASTSVARSANASTLTQL